MTLRLQVASNSVASCSDFLANVIVAQLICNLTDFVYLLGIPRSHNPDLSFVEGPNFDKLIGPFLRCRDTGRSRLCLKKRHLGRFLIPIVTFYYISG